jgi:phage-related protein
MPGNTASLTFKLFGIDVNASRTISGVGVAAAGTAKDLEVLSTGTLKFIGAAGAAGVASVGLAGALGVGLGGAFAAVGVAAALANKNVRKEFKELGQGIKDQISAAAKPVQDAMLQLFKYISQSIKTMAPLFHTFFAAVAPLVTIIGKGLVQAVANLVGEFTPLVKIVTPIVNELFAQLPDLIGNLAAGLTAILSPLSGNTKAFGQLLSTIGSLLPMVGGIIGLLVRLGQQIMPIFSRALLTVVDALSKGLAQVLPVVGQALNRMLPAIGVLAQALFPALASILKALVPILAAVVSSLAGALAKVLPLLVPSFVAIIQVVGQLAKALQPLLPSLVYLALWISKVASNLLSAILPVVVALLNGLMPALKTILPVLIQVVNTVGTALAVAFKQAQPALVQLAKAVGTILVALTPLIPVVVAAALAFLPVIPAVAKIASVLAQGLVPIVLALTPLLVFLAPTLVKIAIAAKLWTIAQAALNVMLAANPIGLVIIAVAALAAGLVYAWKHSETFRNIVIGVFNAIKTAIRNVVDFIITVIRGWFNAQAAVVIGIISLFAKLPGPMGAPFKALKGVAERARTDVNNALDGIKRTVDVTFRGHDKVKGVIQQIQDEMKAHGYSVTARLVRGGAAQKGMRIPGYGGGDIVPLMAEPGEAVVPKHLVPEIADWAKARGIPGFQHGGLVRWPADVNLTASKDALLSRLMGGAVGPAGAGVQRWAGVFLQALALAGQSSAWLGLGLRRMQQESGGNPMAINLWDINAQRGDPSKGLMQVIGSTFRAYANGLISLGIWNPLANIFASIRYTVGRYGTLAAWGRPGGYASGLDYVPFDDFPALLHRGERVLPSGRGGGVTYVYNITVNGAVGGRGEIGTWLLQSIKEVQRRRGVPPALQLKG